MPDQLTHLKPQRLSAGDTVAAVSLSSGAAAAFPHRYQTGKQQFEDTFGVTVIEAPNALRDNRWLYRNPEARADPENQQQRRRYQPSEGWRWLQGKRRVEARLIGGCASSP